MGITKPCEDSAPAGEQASKPKIDLDTILAEEIGEFGWYQRRNLLLTLVVAVFTAFTNEYIFSTARINTRCFIPECEADASQAEFWPAWALHAIPGSGPDSHESCRRFASAAAPPPARLASCPAALFQQNLTVPCDARVYENTNTVVYDFDLGCDEWRRSLVGSVRVAGILASLPLTGWVSDGWGRRTALLLTSVCAAVIGATRVLVRTYVGFVASSFLEALLGSSFTCGYILLMELVGTRYRVRVGASMNSSFAVGQIIMGFVAWRVPNWRHFTLILYIPRFIIISYYWIMSESVRWYMSKGRYEKSEAILKKVASTNGKMLSEKSLKVLNETMEEEKKKEASRKEIKEPWLVVQVFRYKPILFRCLVTPVWWITLSLTYHGLSINAVNLSGNQYFNYVAVAAVEIPGYWTAVLLIDRMGRKPVLLAGYWVCAACQIAYMFIPGELFGLSLAVYMIGKYSISMVLTTLYVYTAELYPTCYRHRLFAFSSMMGCIGSTVAPLLPAAASSLWEGFPFALFGGMALVSGALVAPLPETRGARFPDSMADAARIGLDESNCTNPHIRKPDVE